VSFLATLTESPGVYRMLAADRAVLYVGKAKNLKKRVASYFNKGGHSPRIALMLQQVAAMEVTATRSEAEALILENTLIKKLAPKYNILFRDDKSYPYIGSASRRRRRVPAPFLPSRRLRKEVAVFRSVPQRPCGAREHPADPEDLPAAHLRGVGVRESFAALPDAPDQALQGPLCRPGVKAGLRGRRAPGGNVPARAARGSDRSTDGADGSCGDGLRFEDAAALRDQIRALQAVLHRQYVSSTRDADVDIIAAVVERGSLCVNLAMVRGGLHLGDRAYFPQAAAEAEAAEGLAAFVDQHYADQPVPARADPERISGRGSARGQSNAGPPRNEMERAWVEMALSNARLALQARWQAKARSSGRLAALQEALDMPEPPRRIECFDISHTMGEATVASCVVCVEGAMKKADYRRFNIEGIQPGDDYAAMRQALMRRYEKVATGEAPAPDLILIDGGKGQHRVAREVFAELGLDHLFSIGVAKGEDRKPGLETLFVHGRGMPLQLGMDHAGFHLIQEIRDEAHRFAIVGHRARRARARGRSKLEDIAGVGPARRKKLLAQFGGFDGVKAATIEDLCRVTGISRRLAEEIHKTLR
jgi:excinuclease ABC subunit C